MKIVFRLLTLTALAGALGACGDDPAPSPVDTSDGGASDGAVATSDGGTIGGMVSFDGGAPAVPTGLAVVNSDFKSTSVSLLDPVTGALSKDDCINSGSQPPGLSLALSGDVALPSAPQPGHEVVLIDRSNSALTYLDGTTCAVIRQIPVGTGFFSNPQDVVGLAADKAYVLRYERNDKATPDPADLDDGDDILVIDPSQGRAVSRIALDTFASVAGVQARPAHAVVVGGKVYVALDNLSADFNTAGPGRIVVIDPATDTVSGMIDLTGLKNCNGLEAGPGGTTLVITCQGAFSDGDLQAAGSGIVIYDVSQSPATMVARLTADLFGTRAVFRAGLTGPTTGLAVTSGSFMNTPPDRLWSWDARGGSGTQLLEAKESFVLGKVLWDAAQGRAYITDATMDAPRVLVFDVSGAPKMTGAVTSNPSRGLPPRDLGFY